MSRRTRIHDNEVPEGFTVHDGRGVPTDVGERVELIMRRGSRQTVEAERLRVFTDSPWVWPEGSRAAFDIVGWRNA